MEIFNKTCYTFLGVILTLNLLIVASGNRKSGCTPAPLISLHQGNKVLNNGSRLRITPGSPDPPPLTGKFIENYSILCTSVDPLDFEFTYEKVANNGDCKSIDLFRRNNLFYAQSTIKCQNSQNDTQSSSVDLFRCKHANSVKNSCGHYDIKMFWGNNSLRVTPRSSDGSKIPNQDVTPTATTIPACPVEFVVRLDPKNRLLQAKCLVNISNGTGAVGNLSISLFGQAIVGDGLLRNKITHTSCLRILQLNETCSDCDASQDFQFCPTFLHCSYEDFTASQMILPMYHQIHKDSVENDSQLFIYKTWDEVDMNQMVKITLTPQGKKLLVSCRMSRFPFVPDYSIRYQTGGIWHNANLTDPSGKTGLQLHTQTTEVNYTFLKIPEHLEKICCDAPIWNSTEVVKACHNYHTRDKPEPCPVVFGSLSGCDKKLPHEFARITSGDSDKEKIAQNYLLLLQSLKISKQNSNTPAVGFFPSTLGTLIEAPADYRETGLLKYQQPEKITCYTTHTNAFPNPTMQWFIEDEQLTGNFSPMLYGPMNETVTLINGEGSVIVFQELRNYKFTFKDNGKKLRCVSIYETLSNNNSIEITMNIHVQYQPRSISPTPSESVQPNKKLYLERPQSTIRIEKSFLGEEKLISLNMSANPLPHSVKWVIDNITTLALGQKHRQYEAIKERQTGPNTVELTLHIKLVTSGDFHRKIILKVENAIGVSEHEFRLETSSANSSTDHRPFANETDANELINANSTGMIDHQFNLTCKSPDKSVQKCWWERISEDSRPVLIAAMSPLYNESVSNRFDISVNNESCQLSINSTENSDKGLWQCNLLQADGNLSIARRDLSLLNHPSTPTLELTSFKHNFKIDDPNANSTSVMTCICRNTNEIDLTMTWFLDDEQILTGLDPYGQMHNESEGKLVTYTFQKLHRIFTLEDEHKLLQCYVHYDPFVDAVKYAHIEITPIRPKVVTSTGIEITHDHKEEAQEGLEKLICFNITAEEDDVNDVNLSWIIGNETLQKIEKNDKFETTFRRIQGTAIFEVSIRIKSVSRQILMEKIQLKVDGKRGVADFDIYLIRERQDDSGITTTAIIAISVSCSLFLALVVSLAFFWRKISKQKKLLRGLTENEINDFYEGSPLLGADSDKIDPQNLDVMPYDKDFETDINDITLGKVLGSGEFSLVFQGYSKVTNKTFAVKIAKPSADVTLFKALLSEVKIMIYIGKHENIASLQGVCTEDIRNRKIHIILEMCPNGSLDKYLREHKDAFVNLLEGDSEVRPPSRSEGEVRISTCDLLRWSAEIARGMDYLASKGVVHADLATRNVLLDGNLMAKVSDFGLSKKLYESGLYEKKTKSPLPWRWMALESLLNLTFSSESDIWSYGITLWEIFSLGDVPYPNASWNSDFVETLVSGIRIGKPKFANQKIYSQLKSCLDERPKHRPLFSSLRVFMMETYLEYSDKHSSNENLYCKLEPNFHLNDQSHVLVLRGGGVTASGAGGTRMLNYYSGCGDNF